MQVKAETKEQIGRQLKLKCTGSSTITNDIFRAGSLKKHKKNICLGKINTKLAENADRQDIFDFNFL